MPRRPLAAFLIAAAATAAAAHLTLAQQSPPPATRPAAAGGAADVPVREVVLFSSGVGYFEHYGTVRGDGATELRFKTKQINDILKSLVLQDMDGGRVAAVTYPSQDPINKTLKSFQVDITGNPPMADLLNQLRGAKVTVTVGAEKTTGVILGVERRRAVVKNEKNDDQTAWQPVLNLVAGGRIVSQPMEPISSIELDDPRLKEELNQALLALAGARDQDTKPVKINFVGAGDRHVRLGYVVETPIWKTSYRLILGDKAKVEGGGVATTRPTVADASIQGWAIVENQTDNDWTDVQLSLVSGRPISFVEDLYQPLYIPRPVVEPELFASLRPQRYEGGIPGAVADAATPPAPALVPMAAQNMASTGALREQVYARRMTLQSAEKQSGGQQAFASGGGFGGRAGGDMDATSSVKSLASATSMGELFEYTVGSVTLPRQRSAMIPIITDPIEVERVSIYNPRVLPRNPLNGAKVKNTTRKHLLGGPVTVLDGATYAGDAQIDNVPPGQERLLSYGVDLQMPVDAVDNATDDKMVTGKIVKGVLTVTHKYVRTQAYVADNKSDREKRLVIEHTRQGGNWELVDSPKPTERTDAVYRFEATVPAGKQVKTVVHEQIVTDQLVAIGPNDVGTIDFYRRAGEIPKPVQEALAKAIEMKQAMADTDRQIGEGKSKLSDVTAEQARIRENLKTVAPTSAYYTRLMTKLNDQETTIEQTQKSVEDLQKKMDEQRKALDAYVDGLNVGG